MYIPKHYTGREKNRTIAFMKRFNFGSLITSIDNIPTATHLPFIINEINNDVIITSHLAKANQQWKIIEKQENLVIFTEPHAYVSPAHYDKKENVPTWNYLAVHAYGKGRIIAEEKEVYSVLESMMDSFDPGYKRQWNDLSIKYKSKMAKGIVAFEILVSELQSKEKLSQNKKENERHSIIDAFSKSDGGNEQIIAEYMRTNKG